MAEAQGLARSSGDGIVSIVDNDFISIGSSWERRWQAAAVWSGSFEFIMFFIVVFMVFLVPIFVLCSILFPPLILVLLYYLYWALCRDQSAYKPLRSRSLAFLRWWHNYADYFPVTLVKTKDLSPDERYIFGYHPHGVISCGLIASFITEGARTLDLSQGPDAEAEASCARRGFTSLFPGIVPRPVTLAMNFRPPFLREFFLSFGIMAADRKTFRSVLAQGSGSAVAVVVGGAEEAQETRQGSIRLVLEKRKGFVREAMINGAKLVPVVAFGENDLFNVKTLPEGSLGRRLQDKLRKWFSFSMPIFVGRSVFLKIFGMMPLRKPVWVLVGGAIDCQHIADFDSKNTEHVAALEDAHARYIKAIEELYHGYKDHPLQPYRSKAGLDGDDLSGLTRTQSFQSNGGLTFAS